MSDKYTQDRIHELVRHCWFVVARSVDISKPVAARLLDTPLVVFRDKDGVAKVTDSRCMHRGANLAQGVVTENGIQCPYHGWAYDGTTGKCTRIPSLANGQAIPENAKIKAYPAVEKYGHVWTCLDEPFFEIPTPPELDGLVIDEWRAALPIPAKCGFMAATENFRDMAHFPFVHHVTMGEVDPVIPQLDVQRDGRRIAVSFRYPKVVGAEFSNIGDAWMHYHSYAPGFAAILYEYDKEGKRYLVDFPSPVSKDQCIIFWGIAQDKDFAGGTLDEILHIETNVFNEDTPVLEGLSPGEVPHDGEAVEVSCPADVFTLNYRRATTWVLDEIAARLAKTSENAALEKAS